MAYKIFRGDDRKVMLTFPTDITGWTVWLGVYRCAADDDALILKSTETHTDATNGETTIDLTRTDTDITPGSYVGEIQIKDANDKIRTYGQFTVIVLQDAITETS